MTDLDVTGSATLITAIPGSGKTLRLCEFIEEAYAEGETVYATNIPDLKLPHVPWADPRMWRELPPGSVLVVDEAQDFFPAVRGDPPDYIRDMSRLRHYGVRLILATQRPEYLHPYLRRLCGPHEHLIRINGKESAQIWRSNRLIDDVDNARALKRCDYREWAFPKRLYGVYSTEIVHRVAKGKNHNRRRKLTVYAIAGLLFVGIFVALFAYIKPDGDTEAASKAQPGAARSLFGVAATGDAKPSYATAAEYLKAHQPLVPAIPGSAPVFAGREVVSKPAVYCMSSAAGADVSGTWKPASCTCKTEQGTVYQLELEHCRFVALNGAPYDPYKTPVEAVVPGQVATAPATQAGIPQAIAAPGVAIGAVEGIGNARVTPSTAESWSTGK